MRSNIFKSIFFLCFIFSTTCIFAMPKISVHGTYMGTESKVALIKTNNGTVLKVPLYRLKVPLEGLKRDVATIQASLPLDEMIKYNGNPILQAPKKNKKIK